MQTYTVYSEPVDAKWYMVAMFFFVKKFHKITKRNTEKKEC